MSEEMNKSSQPIKTGVAIPGQPNQNLMIIEEIEGLVSQINNKLENLPEMLLLKRSKLSPKKQAIEDINIFQQTTLFELRKAFE